MRKLVTIKKVDSIHEIPGADFIEACTIGGWTCITKKGEFQVGDKGLYFEIDSWIPATDKRFEFLGKTKLYKNREGWRIRTMKLKGVISQGLLLPLKQFPEIDISKKDQAEILKVEKWEQEEATSNGGLKSGNPEGKFPQFIPKTDQERLQNLPHYFKMYSEEEFEETLKLDGSSMTCYKVEIKLPWYKNLINKIIPNTFNEYKFGVCSRNLELKRPTDKQSKSNFWEAAIKYNIEEKLPFGYAIQGELIAPNIQSNHEKVNEVEYYIFDIFDIDLQRYLTPNERHKVMEDILVGIPHVPIVNNNVKIFQECDSYDDFQERVTGESMNKGTVSEGRVYKSTTTPGLSFKLISNKYLLKHE